MNVRVCGTAVSVSKSSVSSLTNYYWRESLLLITTVVVSKKVRIKIICRCICELRLLLQDAGGISEGKICRGLEDWS